MCARRKCAYKSKCTSMHRHKYALAYTQMYIDIHIHIPLLGECINTDSNFIAKYIQVSLHIICIVYFLSPFGNNIQASCSLTSIKKVQQ